MHRRSVVAGLVAGLLALPALHTTAAAAATGDPTTTSRINEGDPTYAAIDISVERFPDGTAPRHVVLSRDDRFADSLAGSALTGEGPLLFTEPAALTGATSVEIDRLLEPGGRIYLLGGTAAIASTTEQALRERGYDVRRLAGQSRVETAVEVAFEVRRLHPGDEVLLARADGWVDSITGGGIAAERHLPVLVTASDRLSPAVAWWLAADSTTTTTLLGGTAALSDAVAAAVPGPRRIAGTDRTGTAAAIATNLWGEDGTGERDFVVTNGVDDDGWAFGVAAAGLAADGDAPLLLVTDEVTEPTADLVSTCGEPEVDLTVVGDGATVPGALREQLDAADGFACGPDGALTPPAELEPSVECDALVTEYKTLALDQVGPYGFGGFEIMPAIEEDSPSAGDDASGGPTDGDESLTNDTPEDTSSTNVQEEGVDEPDTVKTDGDTAFVVAHGDLQAVDITGTTPAVVDTLDLGDDFGHELLLSGDRLLVVTPHWDFGILEGDVARTSFAPGEPTTTIRLVDVTDPANLTVLDTVELDGSHRSARMIGSVVRLVMQTDPSFPFVYPTDDSDAAVHAAAERNREIIEASTAEDWLPDFVDCADVSLPPVESGMSTVSVLTFDLASGIEPTSSAAVTANAETVYASTTRLYVTTGRWEWEPDALGSQVTTEVHGFDITDPAATTYVGSGAVEGYALNQFSLSEHEGFLRIATTTAPPWREDGEEGEQSESMVTVLDEQAGELVQVGRVSGLGLGERIYAVRYFGDVAAVVTFRQVDPLYLLDLSNPAAPSVAGELKLLGYSAYLHKVADGRLLGVGAAADEDGMVTGAQVTLFDTSDPSSPQVVDQVTFESGYTSVEYDHHAFLHWPATGLAVIPIEQHGETGTGFVGAVGLDVTADGLTEAGRASHQDDASGSEWWPSINRSFVDGDSLYTVSEVGIERADLGDLTERAFIRF
ncbi:MAG TPA: beta-propeller domain-containing protein [Acidimicrobiales bacterium]|nr:beta-propeller domain-containing protein [Acidimicrobiales bacterium]